VSRYDWLLFLHVTAAFALISAITLYTVGLIASWGRDRPSEVTSLFRLQRPAGALVGLGSAGVLIFGIWLALDRDYGLGDEWVIAAIVLWVVSVGMGVLIGKEIAPAVKLAARLSQEGDQPSPELKERMRSGRVLVLHVLSTGSVAAMTALMVFKPGAL
jgi:uncharacterized membrane protein